MAHVSSGLYEVRTEIAEALARDLVGPVDPGEVLDEPPLQRYICGVLYPRGMDAGLGAEEDPGLEAGGDSDNEGSSSDPPVSAANIQFPSSMGLTFAVDPAATEAVLVATSGARYERTEPDGKQLRWSRRALELLQLRIPVSEVTRGTRADLGEDVELFYRVREPDVAGLVAVTVVVSNSKHIADRSKRPHEEAVFQPRVDIKADAPTAAPFAARPAMRGSIDEELRGYDLLYRHAAPMAVGHGCATDWVKVGDFAEWRISTSVVPSYELRLADSNPDIPVEGLGMLELAKQDKEVVLQTLRKLVEGYEVWLSERRKEIPSLDETHHDAAETNLANAEVVASRMRVGIATLESDEPSWRAFRLMNEAMLEQRTRDEWKKHGSVGELPDPAGMRWRPFQIAFILLCLKGIADPASADRSIADLLWFPTGGGKTEAYLGLIAFTVFRRRLSRGDAGGGISVIMRYTLRLLTVQQFERASMLICACESIRASRDDLGTEPISIGLWVGQDTTPNTRDQAQESLTILRTNRTVKKRNPMQLQTCPWCGTRLAVRNYYMQEGSNPKLVIACRNDDCEFGSGLPVFVVDQDIYQYRPTLLIATVDKFASLPWRETTPSLFNASNPKADAPELIIQDELHLISGPLGTLVGLYETAVDALCDSNGSRPKVIASTATIRQADPQTRALFDRDVRQFPPQIFDARYCYFASEASPEEKGTRLYVGVCAPGTSQTTLLIRTYAVLLQAAEERRQQLGDRPDADELCDPYWTLVGYFSSLRVLGGARLAAQDDVVDRIAYLAKSHGTTPRELEEDLLELTSRRSSSELPVALAKLATPLGNEGCPDIVLATNMISVGVDVPRLGMMAVMGQPQSTSEYIQASSRVGRVSPGLVVTMYNSARSRDRSHYESFVPFHSALYRQVESTSVTPFSARARDRGLHAVLVSLVRNTDPEMMPNDAAAHIDSSSPSIARAVEEIVRRAGSVSPDEAEDTKAQLERTVRTWDEHARRDADLSYWNFKEPSHSLLIQAEDDTETPDSFPTLWSLRDVDKSSNIFLVKRRVK